MQHTRLKKTFLMSIFSNTIFGARYLRACIFYLMIASILPAGNALAAVVTVDGSDAIWLAGRTDLAIPPAGVLWPGGLARHPVTPELIQETLPPSLSITGGDVLQVADPAIGGVSFFNGFGAPFYGPGGNGLSGSDLGSFGGISGYLGPQGPLVGVFLDNLIPVAGPPPRLDFTPGGLGIDFLSLAPALGQIFYIGDGITSGGDFQSFTAPFGATRVFFGIPDGFGFVGVPGAYDDNDGRYVIGVGINEPPPAVPVPAAVWLFGTALIGFIGFGRRRNVA